MSPKTAFAKTLAALNSNAEISREEIRKWIEAADLKTLSLLYVLTNKASSRITPKLTMKETCDLIRRYYLTCIRKNPRSSDYMLSRYEAAWTMVAWFRHLVSKLPETKNELKATVDEITSLYLNSKQSVQDALVNGFLEHLFETPSFREYFAHWKSDPKLAEPHKWALMWGKDHEGSNLI
jgi:hypothetical protein